MEGTGGGITAELYKAIITVVDERVKEIRVTREDFDELKGIVRELAQAQARTEARVEELAQAQKRTEEEVRKLAIGLRETRQMVGGLSDTVGYRLEDEAYKSLPHLLKRDFNLEVEGRLIRKYVEYNHEKIDEVNIYGRGRRNGEYLWIFGECKSKLGRQDVDHFLKKVNRVEKVTAGGQKVLIAVTYNTLPAVEKYAAEKGVKVYFSYEL